MLGKIAFLLCLFTLVSCSKKETGHSDGVVAPDREAVAAGSGLPQPRTETDLLDCQDMNGVSVYCGYQNPEDLVLLPGGGSLIVS